MKFYPEDIILIILALLFPPATVLLIRGCGPDLLINVLLCFLGGLPGILHAFWIFYLKKNNEEWWWKRQRVPKGLAT